LKECAMAASRMPDGTPAEAAVPVSDIAIVGAGNAGLATAIAAADSGFSVTLIGPSPGVGDGRTIALFDGSWRMLESWGVAQRLDSTVAPLMVMRIVDDTGSLFRQPPV
jgi:2-octaprenyl-6-methoxyphenol hydroxylase